MGDRELAFVIAGAQKSGTTTLDAIFRQHPQIQMARVKETHFFDNDERDWSSPDYRALDEYFDICEDRVRGEATPITMYWRPAIRRLHDYNPDVRLVLILRNPVTRAFSNWRHERFHGREDAPFGEAIRSGRSRVYTQGTPEGLHRFFSYVERGLYGDQLLYLLKFFPRKSIHCEIYEEFFGGQRAALARIANFLGIDNFPAEVPDIHLNSTRNAQHGETLSHVDVVYLADIFRPQIEGVEQFLNRRIPSWRNPDSSPEEDVRVVSRPSEPICPIPPRWS